MIVKMRNVAVSAPGHSWTIFDDVERVTHRPISAEVSENEEQFHPDYFVQARTVDNEVDKTMKDYVYITCAMRDDSVINICTNMVVYILNDEGKTVEKI